MTKPEKDLDRALNATEPNGDPSIDALVMLAADIERDLAVEAPPASRDRAMFIEGVAARKRSMWSSLTIPAVAGLALLGFIAFSGRAAMPGDALYPVRRVLNSAGLASSPVEEATRHLNQARLLLAKAEGAGSAGSEERAARYATTALKILGQAEEHMRYLEARDRQRLGAQIDSLTAQAVTFIQLDVDESVESDRDDNSGSGSDDSDSDDNSGSASDDSGSDDNSGSGSDDSDSDDNSGSGSDDSGSDDSNRDEISGSDDSGGDNSGSGSDNSGSGSGDDREDVLDDRSDAMEDRADH